MCSNNNTLFTQGTRVMCCNSIYKLYNNTQEHNNTLLHYYIITIETKPRSNHEERHHYILTNLEQHKMIEIHLKS